MTVRGVCLDSAYELMNICGVSPVGDRGYVRRKFEERFPDFESNVEFLRRLGLLDISGDEIHSILKPPITTGPVVDALRANIRRFPEVEEFMDDFHPEGDVLVCRPTLTEIVKSADVRNMLLSFGLLEVTAGTCTIRDRALVSHVRGKEMSLQSLIKRLRRQELLGEAAERFVLAYELGQVDDYPGVVLDSAVKHVSPHDVGARYDIESFCKKAAALGQYEKIYIEVKAVTTDDCRFFWSKNEIGSAQRWGDRYYL